MQTSMENNSAHCNECKPSRTVGLAWHMRRGVKFFAILWQYIPLSWYMLRRFGFRSFYTFWHTKLFVLDEGGEFDLLAPIYKRFPMLLRSPYKVEIEHTTVCNKKCIFCSHTHWGTPPAQMTFEQYKSIIEAMPNLKWVNMAGIGSNFLNRDFMKIIQYSRDLHLNVNFVDEFDFFDEDRARKVVGMGINSIYVSFDAATRATYESIKNGCDYDKALANIRTLLRVKQEMGSPFPVVHFRFIVTKYNYHEIPAYLDLIASLPNRGVLARVEFIGLIEFEEIKEYNMPLNELPATIIDGLWAKAKEHNLNVHFSHADPSCLAEMHTCVRWAEPFVLVTGEVIADCAILMQGKRDYLKSMSFGNVFETPFQQIWDSQKYKEFRRDVVNRNAKVPQTCELCCAFKVAERIDRLGVG